MMNNEVPVLWDEECLNSSIYKDMCNGISAAAAKKQMTTKVYTDCAKLMEDASSDRTVIVIGYESPRLRDNLLRLTGKRRQVILAGLDAERFGSGISSTSPSRRGATAMLIQYLVACKKERIALVACGESSVNDLMRCEILKGYLYTSGQSDYYFIVWMSSNPTVAAVDGDGRVTGRSAGEATITAITDRGECAACKVTVRKESGNAASKKPALDHPPLNLVIQYNNAHPSQKLQLINTSGSFVYAYQWMSSNPEVATVDPEGLVTAQKPGTTTVTALATNGQALRCAVTVNSDVGKVTLNKRDLLLRTVGSKEALTASVAVEDGVNVPITWVSSNPGVATVDASGVVTAVADGEAKITALSPDGRFDSCSVFVGLAADKYDTEEDLAEELKLPDPYVAVRMNRLS